MTDRVELDSGGDLLELDSAGDVWLWETEGAAAGRIMASMADSGGLAGKGGLAGQGGGLAG